MDFLPLTALSRSYRSFDESVKVNEETLKYFVSCARLAPSAANKQPLKYFLSCDEKTNALIQVRTRWAAKLPAWKLPPEGHRPTAFIVITVDQTVSEKADRDVGIAAQTILLAAASKGLGGCMIGAFDPAVASDLNLDARYVPALIVALGKPDEQVIIEDADGSVDYYRDENGIHHVPKRPLNELIIGGKSHE